MLHQSETTTEGGLSQTRWRGAGVGNRLDCETGVLLRALLQPVFQQSTTWSNLRRHLARKGFGLGFHNGRLVLTDRDSGERICSCKFLGQPLRTLTSRLGRVKVLAARDGLGGGTLLA